jgi:transcriptional regulator with XRE-family HTH domain
MTTMVMQPGTPAACEPAMTVRDPLAGLREAIASARAEAERLLACFRHAAGLSQARLAARIGYSATVVAHAELGRRPVSAEFWELADGELGASGDLTAQGTRIKNLISARREEQRRLDKARHAVRLARLLPQPREDDMTAAAAAVLAPAAATPAAGRCPHCHQQVTLITQIAAQPDAGTGRGHASSRLPDGRGPWC